MFAFDSIPHMRSKVEAARSRTVTCSAAAPLPYLPCAGVRSVAGRFMLGGIDQRVPMESPILSLPAKYRHSPGFLLNLFEVNDGSCSSA